MGIYVSNNPLVLKNAASNKISDKLIYIEAGFLNVLTTVRDLVHKGHVLVSHPLSGSVKPGETPYKTVMISGEKGALDKNSLSLIEESIQTCVKFEASIAKMEWENKTLADFQLIDYDLIFG